MALGTWPSMTSAVDGPRRQLLRHHARRMLLQQWAFLLGVCGNWLRDGIQAVPARLGLAALANFSFRWARRRLSHYSCDNRAEWDRLRYHFGRWQLLLVSLWLRYSF